MSQDTTWVAAAAVRSGGGPLDCDLFFIVALIMCGVFVFGLVFVIYQSIDISEHIRTYML